ncbi:MAG: hypothetical protein DWQ10_02195 [Calditrichaeota bacterium]|nr:MAG: hypothetical protein DWQ10_02195 [Calditrichota bacterium]
MQIKNVTSTSLSSCQSSQLCSGKDRRSAELKLNDGARDSDKIELSNDAQNKYLASINKNEKNTDDAESVNQSNSDEVQQSENQLSEEEKNEVRKLKARDSEVRVHEQAHLAAAGGLARGGANFSYTVGPDGKRYATGGEVSIDTSAVAGNPQATIRKMNTVRKAALAPMNPSAADRSIAADAAATAAKARSDFMDETALGEIQTSNSIVNNGHTGEKDRIINTYNLQKGLQVYEGVL